MSRIKVELPQNFSFSVSIPIRITDINYGGHVGNDSILTILHEARMQYLKHHGYSEMDVDGVGLIMSDVGIEFKREVFYGDELVVSINAGSFTKVSFDIIYKVEKRSTEQPSLVAAAKTGMVCYDYKRKKVSAIPQAVIEKLKEK